MLLWARKGTTQGTVRVNADDAEQCFVGLGGDTASTGVLGMKKPSAFLLVFDFVSVPCAGKSPTCKACVYMALDRVVANWATRWSQSAGNPFDRSVLRACNDDEEENRTPFYALVQFEIRADGNSEVT